jgi:hypothetical protein
MEDGADMAARFTLEVFAFAIIRAMELITILNHCHRHRGFVYQHARFGPDKKSIKVDIRPRESSAAVCSKCHQPAPGYYHLPERRFEFIPFWGILVYFLYRMRRVHCRNCGIVAEAVPWGDGKRQLTRAYMRFLARWARKLSWKETAESFHTSWNQVCDAVEYVVGWGLEHRKLEAIRAIGVDEIQYAKGHKYLTLVYQIDRAYPAALGRQGTHHRILPRFLHRHRRATGFSDRVCLLRYVAALPGRDPPEMFPGAAYSRPLSCRGQDEQGVGRSSRRRITQDGPGRPRAVAEEISLLCSEA